MKKIVIQAKYLGGHPAHDKAEPLAVEIGDDGLRAKRFKTIFEFDWDGIDGIHVEGPEQIKKRVTATRVLAVGVFALVLKKKRKVAYLTVSTAQGEAIFEVLKHTPIDLRAKLSEAIAKASAGT